MCIVIDANTFSTVFNPDSQKHGDFKPVLEWIVHGRGKIVYGGDKYKQELRNARKYHGLFSELSKVSKVIEVDCQRVNEIQEEVAGRVDHRDFDDPHLIAIIIVSGCKLICSDDSSAYPFLKRKDLYLNKVSRPKIYRRSTNRDLLCDNNIADICKPCSKLPKATIQKLML